MRLWLTALAWCCLASPAWAVFGVSSTTGSTGQLAVSSITLSFTVTTETLLVVTCGMGDATLATRQVTNVTWNTTESFTQVTESDDANFEHSEIWALAPVATGTHNVVVSFAAAVAQSACGVTGFNDASTTLGTPNTNTALAANPSVTVVDSASGDLVVSVVASDLGSIGTTNQNGTLLWETEDVGPNDSDFNTQVQTATGASTVAAWTAASDLWATAGVAVKPAAIPTVVGCRLLQDGTSKRLLQDGTSGRIFQGGGSGCGGGAPPTVVPMRMLLGNGL